jgi:hypothetical protein
LEVSSWTRTTMLRPTPTTSPSNRSSRSVRGRELRELREVLGPSKRIKNEGFNQYTWMDGGGMLPGFPDFPAIWRGGAVCQSRPAVLALQRASAPALPKTTRPLEE